MGSKFQEDKKPSKTSGPKMPNFWSYSRWRDYELCPRAYHAKHILKKGGGTNAAMERGIQIHKEGELYLKDVTNRMPKSFKMFNDALKMLKKLGASAEKDYAVDPGMKPIDTTEFGKVWCRFKADSSIIYPETVLTAIDFKTGKKYGTHQDQAEVGALVIAPHVRAVKSIDFEFWYLDSGDTEEYSFPMKLMPALIKKWKARASKMLTAKSFPPVPSKDACRFCPIRSDKAGGTCDAWKKA